MKRRHNVFLVMSAYVFVLTMIIGIAISANRLITVWSENAPIAAPKTVVIDAGHGGVDGGATSCTGVLESNINLEIALKLNDTMHLLGINTIMIRATDCSIYTQGQTIAAKKVSDLKERVRIINESENAILVSIHQNHFSDSRYHGAQVFYAATENSDILAKELQKQLKFGLNAESNRNIKKADGIYLMQHITCPGVLVECGFLSNAEEEALLRDDSYQMKICSVIACVCSRYLHAA